MTHFNYTIFLGVNFKKLTVIVGLRDGGEPGRDPDGGEVRAPGIRGANIPGARLGPA